MSISNNTITEMVQLKNNYYLKIEIKKLNLFDQMDLDLL